MTLGPWLTWLGILVALGVNVLAYRTYQATLHDLEQVRLRQYGIELERDLALARVQALRKTCGKTDWSW